MNAKKNMRFCLIFGVMLLSGCQAIGLSTAVGPSRSAIMSKQSDKFPSGIMVVDVSDSIARDIRSSEQTSSFADTLGEALPVGSVVGVGDTLEVSIWESPPAILFSPMATETRTLIGLQTSKSSSLPELLVGASGTISVPFAGEVPASGRTLRQIERDIVARLQGRANQPQVIVRLLRNATSTVTVVGDVTTTLRVPLSPRGERVLDALAQAGGTRQPINKMTVQLTRGGQVHRMPLQAIVNDPRNNVVLKPDDVVAAFYQPYSFIALGASGRSEEVPFEGTGVVLSQALGRIGGLQAGRADPKGVFLFRWEGSDWPLAKQAGPNVLPVNGKFPVIYRVDLTKPESYFAAQNFAMVNGDIVFVSNAPVAEFERFVNILASTILPIATVRNSLNVN